MSVTRNVVPISFLLLSLANAHPAPASSTDTELTGEVTPIGATALPPASATPENKPKASATDCGKASAVPVAADAKEEGTAQQNVHRLHATKGNLSTETEAEVTGEFLFTEEDCRELAKHGVLATPARGRDTPTFHSGGLLLSCTRSVRLKLRNASINIGAGAIVFIRANQYVAMVMNLHDDRHRSVMVKIGDRKYTIAPGRELLLTSLLHLTYDEANMAPGVWYRTVNEDFPTDDSKTFETQFSTLSALRLIPVLRSVAANRKEHGNKIIKTAAAVYAVSRDGRPFRWQLDEAEVRASRVESECRKALKEAFPEELLTTKGDNN